MFSDRWWFAVQMSSVWTCLQATRQSDKTPALRVFNFWTTVPLYYLSLQGQAESAPQDPHGYSTWGVHLKQTIENLTCSFDTRTMDFFYILIKTLKYSDFEHMYVHVDLYFCIRVKRFLYYVLYWTRITCASDRITCAGTQNKGITFCQCRWSRMLCWVFTRRTIAFLVLLLNHNIFLYCMVRQ